jgi:hypothetical protein
MVENVQTQWQTRLRHSEVRIPQVDFPTLNCSKDDIAKYKVSLAAAKSHCVELVNNQAIAGVQLG